MFHNYQKLTNLRIGSYIPVQYLILLVFLVAVMYSVTMEAMGRWPDFPIQIINKYLSLYIPIVWAIENFYRLQWIRLHYWLHNTRLEKIIFYFLVTGLLIKLFVLWHNYWCFSVMVKYWDVVIQRCVCFLYQLWYLCYLVCQ